MQPNMSMNITDSLAVRQVSANRYESLRFPEKMGNSANIAFGGCTLGVAAAAVHEGVSEPYRLYSFTGQFLGPALTARKLMCTVREVRKTRSFITKVVEVSQKQDNGSERTCLIALADFHTIEPASLLIYSKHPSTEHSSVQNSPSVAEHRQNLVRSGATSAESAELHTKAFGLMAKFFDNKICPEAINGQCLVGFGTAAKTTQDHLPLVERTAADWIRCRQPLETPGQHASSLAFVMDAAISFLPLTLSGLSLSDAGACSTLDFSLRFLTNEVNINEWHLREWRTIAADGGRTYSEAQLWDQDGKMVVSMTQSSILRSKANGTSKL